jgi:hypothetical protein
MTMQPTELRQEIAAVFGEIVAAKRLARAGRVIELEGLDKRIGALCEAVVLLPAEEGRDMLPLLEDLRLSLDELANALKAATPADEPRSR